MTLDEERDNVGAAVVYQPYPGARAEDGDIVSVGTGLVFVLYVGDRTPKGTRAEDLVLA